VFRAEPPGEEELSRIYDEDYFHDQPGRASRHGYADYLRDGKLHRSNARRRLRLLSSHAPRRGRLLDVGCAGGFFVDEACRAGWEASGVDVSIAMVEWARSELGVPVECVSFAEADVSVSGLDVVTMWDYIEHSIDPRGDLEKAHACLRPGGVLALSTGDIGTLSARVAGKRWHLLTPEHHNFFFDRRRLNRLLADTGFDVLDARYRSNLYSLEHVFYKLETLGPSKAARTLASVLGRFRLGSIGIPLNLFDIVTVVARRR